MNKQAHFKSWENFMENAPIPLEKLKKLYSETTVYPIKQHIFRAFRKTDYDKVNVVILGQD